MAQRTTLDELRAYIMPLTIASFGWYMTSLINEIKSDVKLLLETKAIHGEQIEQYRRRIDKLEGKVFSMNVYLPNYMRFIFDKTKTLHFHNGEFYYA